MNILLINHYAGSLRHGMEYRPYYLAREWLKMGHHPMIVASSVSHLRSKAPKVEGLFTQETVEGIPYLWVKTPQYSGNGVRRALNIFSFVTALRLYGFITFLRVSGIAGNSKGTLKRVSYSGAIYANKQLSMSEILFIQI